MAGRVLVMVCALLAAPLSAATPRHRSASEFLVQTVGATWSYDGPMGPSGVLTVLSREADGSIHVMERDANGGTSSLVWRLRRGDWTETLPSRGGQAVVILPAKLKKGTRWKWTQPDVLGRLGTHRFEVMNLSETVTLKDGTQIPNCLRVQEYCPDLGESQPVTRWFAPGKGEVAVKVGDIWYRSLTQFNAPARKRM